MVKTEISDEIEFASEKEPDWWRGASIYQIYPRSFQDSNSDGIGDLKGIVQRLPYVASLGVEAIWISPFYRSPMADFGYDVSNYREVDPIFGTLADFDLVAETAHRLGLKVMIDLVLSHSSDQHPWFAESRSSKTNAKADWYVWADPKSDGTPPNNWLSVFGGSAWAWDPRREQYYLHNFLANQPDLNLHNRDVQDELLDVARFWLLRGVDGFRLDTINFYFHDPELRDNPPLPPEDRNASIAPAVNPYNHQRHVFSKNRPENLEFLKRFNEALRPFNAAALGEIGDAQRGMELLGEYTSGGDKVQMCYAFEFLSQEPASANRIAEIFAYNSGPISDGWPCWAFSNHDVMRHASRWALSAGAVRAYILLLCCLRGSICLYQGEELGLRDADLPIELITDPYGREFWPEYKGRDGCRTPLPWDASQTHAGFSAAESTWLPLDPEHLGAAVSHQDADLGSLLNHYRRALKLRRKFSALRIGKQSQPIAIGELLFFERRIGDERILCAFNLSENEENLTLPPGTWIDLGGELDGVQPVADGRVTLGAWQAFIAYKDIEGGTDGGY